MKSALALMVDGGLWWFFLHVFLYVKNRLHSDDVEKPSTIHHPPSQKKPQRGGFGVTALANALSAQGIAP